MKQKSTKLINFPLGPFITLSPLPPNAYKNKVFKIYFVIKNESKIYIEPHLNKFIP